MTRLLTVLFLTAAVAGCGGEKKPRPEPKLPVALAQQLSARSDSVAAALDAGDSCRALEEAVHLRHATVAAVNAGRVPAPFQEQLGSSVQDLVRRIQCVPSPAEEEHGKGKRKGKHKDKD
jgi:hypothetical protein